MSDDKKKVTSFPSILGEWDAGTDSEKPPPRGWLLGTVYCRGFLSSLFGSGGVGKTSVIYLRVLSLATKRMLTGEHVFQRCRVLIISLEDGGDELRRRILAARLHYNIALDDLKGWLFLAALTRADGKLMVTDERGRSQVSSLAAKLEQIIVARKIDLVVIDPFKKTHSVAENDNTGIDEVVQILTDLAVKHNIAVDVPHHVAKGDSDPGNADRGRGASSLKDALRLVRTVSSMTLDEAKTLGVSEADRRTLIRVDDAKVNITRPADAKWFRLVGVDIGNGNDLYPNGDNVQTVEVWKPPALFDGVSVPAIHRILDDIDAGLPDGNRYSDAPKAGERAVWRVIGRHCPGKAEGPARTIIKTWKTSGLLVSRPYRNPVTRKDVAGLFVDNEKRPS